MITKPSSLLISSSAMVACSMMLPTQANAQDSGASRLDEIVVTARKREESLQDIPVAITAFSAKDIERSTMQSMEDIAAYTPGLTFNSFSAGNYAIPTIRGVAQTDITNIENNVSTFLNGIYLSNKSGLDISLLDLERIEVVKGPQSALYGRNSFAGSINYVMNAPDETLGGSINATLGSDERQGLTGALNFPLGERAAGRIAVGYDSFDGTIGNISDDENLGGYDKLSFAATVTANPIDALTIDAFLFTTDEENDHSPILQVDNNCAPGIDSFGFTLPLNASFCGELPAADEVDIDPRATGGDKKSILAGVSVNYETDAGTLSALASYSDSESRDNGDNDFTASGTDYRVFSFITFQIVDTINLATFTGNEFETEDTSLELRFRSNQDNALRWMVGAFYSKTNLTESLFQSIVGDPSGLAPVTGPFLAGGVPIQNDPNNSTVLTVSDFDLESAAIFAELGYDFTNEWNATLELRYSNETRDANLPLSVGAPGPGQVSEDFSYVTPRLIVNYAPDGSDTLLYSSFARGVKAGGFNNTSSSIIEDATYDEESNWTFEVGYKNTFGDGRYQFNAAAYFIDWEDLQIRSFGAANLALIQNVSGASVTGFETSVVAALTDNFTLSAGYAYTDPTYDDDAAVSGSRRECGIPAVICQRDDAGAAIIGGNQLERTSQNQFNMTAEFTKDFDNGWGSFARLDATYQSEQPNAINQNSVPDRTLVNVRLGLENERYSVSLWAKNLTDESYARAALFFNVPDAFPVFSYKSILAERRTFGITAGYRF
ncbi:MAG: TonB-dependent receptor [Pseudomonadota bacterium]